MIQKQSIYKRLKEAVEIANVIEAAEDLFVSLDSESIKTLDQTLLRMLDEIREDQAAKISKVPESS